MMKSIVGGFVLGLMLLPLVVRAQETAATAKPYLTPAKQVAWWHVGDTAKFKLAAGQLPEGTTAVEGLITNVEGDEVTRVKISHDEFSKDGWQWKPAVPGYYEVEFSALVGEKNDRVRLARPYTIRGRDNKGNLITKDFTRDRQAVAFLPTPMEEKPRAGQFGYDYENNPEAVLLGKLMGFDFARVLVDWGNVDPKRACEPVKGQFNWDKLDQHIDMLSKAGMQIMGQISFTPLWASPHPEKTNVNICVVEATAYAPVNTNDYADFATAAVNRYKDRVRFWEIWNEPSIPGGSVYWSDTTDNYAKILESGYKAIKAAQPEATVSLGGIGPRKPYHAFYNRLLKMGMDKYWDVLSLHGAWNSPEDFREIDARYNVAPKPAMSTEWHAILQGNMQSDPILSETALSFKMMKDFLYQLKAGVVRIIAFEMVNLTEKEALPFAIENKWFTHASGFFRRQPQLEPRQPGIVLANFIEVVGKKATYVKEFKLSDEAIALQLDTARGKLVVFWGETGPVTAKSLKPFMQPDSQVRDWEGRTLALKSGTELEAKRIYYMLSPNEDAVSKAVAADKLVYIRKATRSAQSLVKASYVTGKLFPTLDGALNVPASGWIASDWKLGKLKPEAHDEAFSARAVVGASEDGLDVIVEVKDREHVQKEPSPAFWNGDSLQLAFDCEGSGFVGGNTEFVCALTESGPAIWKLLAADPRGDIPAKWSPANGPAKFAEIKVDRESDTTRYRLRIPWSELYPMTFDPAKPIRVSFAVNNNNGSGRIEMTEWGSGITKDKDPSAYGQLNPPGK